MYYAKQAKEEASRIEDLNIKAIYDSIWKEYVVGKFDIELMIKKKVSKGEYSLDVTIPIYVKYSRRGEDVNAYLDSSGEGTRIGSLISCLEYFGYVVKFTLEGTEEYLKLNISW